MCYQCEVVVVRSRNTGEKTRKRRGRRCTWYSTKHGWPMQSVQFFDGWRHHYVTFSLPTACGTTQWETSNEGVAIVDSPVHVICVLMSREKVRTGNRGMQMLKDRNSMSQPWNASVKANYFACWCHHLTANQSKQRPESTVRLRPMALCVPSAPS